MRGIARVLADGVAKGAGFLAGPTHLTTCAHVVNIALGRGDPRATEPPGENEHLELDFPNDPEGGGNAATRRTGRVLPNGWHPPTQEGQEPGPMDDIAVLLLDAPMPEDSVPRLQGDDWLPDLGTRLCGWGTPRGSKEGLWAQATLSGAQGYLRQVDLEKDKPELQQGFSGGPLWVQKDGRILGMLV